MSRSSRPASSAAPSCAPTLARLGSIRRRTLRVFLARHPDGLPPPGPTVGPVADAEVRPTRLKPAVVAGVIVALIVVLVLVFRAFGLPAPAADPAGASPQAAQVEPAGPGQDGGLMDAGIRTPLIEAFRRADVPREVRLDAAQGQLAPRGVEQLALLMLLADDADDEVRGAADAHARRPAARDRGADAGTVGGDQRDGAVLRRPRRRPAGVVGRDRRTGRSTPAPTRRWDTDRGGAGRPGGGRRRRDVGHPADPADDRRAAGAGGDEGLARDAIDPGPRPEQAGGVGGPEQSRS